MNRIAIISILFGCMLLTSGCIEIGYKTEVKVSIGKKKPTSTPVVVDNGYPNSTPASMPAAAKKAQPNNRYNYIMVSLAKKKRATDAKAQRLKQSRQRQQKAKQNKSKSFFAKFIN